MNLMNTDSEKRRPIPWDGGNAGNIGGYNGMEQQLKEALDGKTGSYTLPFLWMHGESQERLYEEILAIKNSGLSEFCAESRPYESFCKDAWWDDFAFLLKTAKELGMRVWLLDDRKFPTGYANGYLEAPERAHLRKVLIREFQSEMLGPMKRAKLSLSARLKKGESILSVIAYRHRDRKEGLDFSTAVDLTPTMRDGTVQWDVPEGIWRVSVTVRTAYAGRADDRFSYYIDMLNPDSCRAMIDAVYQPHYDRFGEYFGNTFAGFFSDEPGFLNTIGTYHNTLGVMFSPYPWREDLPRLIAESAGLDEKTVRLALPALWEDLGEITSCIRMHYMEVVTKLYSENFGYLLGDWCRAHGVMYIGHVIEDMGAHMRLAYGSGHFFRALDGQDMAGIDIVLMQDVPGITDCIHRAPLTDGGTADPSFFRYTLPKLASSHAHIQPLKKGRAMCEIFGAFGWAEGLPYMKALADSMLASGINRFVPHAFSPKAEDPDCPPHFYNGGKNNQYPLFGSLMAYMERTVHVLENATHRADVAVFYNAEGEWTGGKNGIFHEVCRTLTQSLIDFDILPFDVLADATVENGRLLVNGEGYGALIVSESEILPIDRLRCFSRLAEAGLPVLFTDALPSASAEGDPIGEYLPRFDCVPLADAPEHLRDMGLCHVRGLSEDAKSLRFYHVSRGGREIYLFSNESIYEDIAVPLRLKESGACLVYDPWENRCYRADAPHGLLRLTLEKGNMVFVIFGEEIDESLPLFTRELDREVLDLRYEIAVKDEGDADYRVIATDSPLLDITDDGCLPRFSGSIRYRTTFKAQAGYTVLDLGQVGETAEVWVNGVYVGSRINAPYKVRIADAVKEGSNTLEVIVRNNPGHRRRDKLSTYIQIPPSGILGDVAICKYGL